jgi:hypothetical protein
MLPAETKSLLATGVFVPNYFNRRYPVRAGRLLLCSLPMPPGLVNRLECEGMSITQEVAEQISEAQS